MPSMAQQSTPSSPQESNLEEIVVTAQRREERLQDVPITITSLSADQLVAVNAVKLSDIAALTPALRFDPVGAFVEPTIRGVTTSFVLPGNGSNVGTYIDGYISPNPLAADFQLLNVQDIQVLKGPQGTLFGRNTTGGAILVNTAEPSPNTHGMLEASYGSYHTQEYNGYATTGFGEKLAVDVAAIYRKSDGYVTNIATGDNDAGASENWSARVGVKANLLDNLSVLLHVEHQNADDPTNIDASPYNSNGRPLTVGAVVPGSIIATRPNDISDGFPPSFTLKSDAYQLTTTATFDFATLTSYSQYRQDNTNTLQDLTYVSPEIVHVGIRGPDHATTQELLLTSKPGPRLQWTAGAYYFDFLDSTVVTIAIGPGYPNTPTAQTRVDTRSFAGYFDATYEVVDRLFLTAGVRYNHDEIPSADGKYPGVPTEVFPKFSGDKVLPRAVIRYALDDHSNVYGSFSLGYKAPIYNVADPVITPAIKAESISAFEVGYKYAYRRLAVDLATYYYDYKNQQESSLIIVNGLTESVLTNAASSHIYGLDGEVRYDIISNFEINAAAAYTHAYYQSFPGAPSYSQCLSVACGAGYGSFDVSPINATGMQMLRSPEFTGSLGFRYTQALFNGKLGLSSNLYYTSKFYFDTADEFSQSHYETLAVRAEWTDPRDRYTVAVYGNNVTNTHYLTQVFANTPAVGAVWGAPATVGGSIRVKF
jgi:iron complex outermembrane receptor protein